MQSTKIDFLYLTEKDNISANVLDMNACINVMEKTFNILNKDDYIMGGMKHNRHDISLKFLDKPIGNMPPNEPGRGFYGMSSYVGGDFNICGLKWYGANNHNKSKQLPNTIPMIILNDKHTGAPKSIMSGNLISNMSTGAITGISAKYCGNKIGDTLAIIGATEINAFTLNALVNNNTNLKEIKIYDSDNQSLEHYIHFITDKSFISSSIKLTVTNSIEQALKDADIISIATTANYKATINLNTIKKGATVFLLSDVEIDSDLIKSSTIVLDNLKMYKEECIDYDKPYANSNAKLGFKILDLLDSQSLSSDQVTNLHDIVTSQQYLRKNNDEIILVGLYNMVIFDIAWAYTIYQNAIEQQVGTTLNLWNTPVNI